MAECFSWVYQTKHSGLKLLYKDQRNIHQDLIHQHHFKVPKEFSTVMAFRIAPKFESTTRSDFNHPYLEKLDYKYYHPQLFTNSIHKYAPNKGRKKFFHDYRRCHVSEQTLEKNLEGLPTPFRPTWYCDKTSRVLGRRKIDREALFPVIQNKPLYTLSNRIPDRERDRDKKFMDEVKQHRMQYKDLTGSRHERSSYFHCPSPAGDVFLERKRGTGIQSDYPNNLRVSQEHTETLARAEPMVQFMENDIY